jgi:hypothetical protein
MKIDTEAVAEYQEIHRREFGEEISAVDAETRGKELCELYKLLINHKLKNEPSKSKSERS